MKITDKNAIYEAMKAGRVISLNFESRGDSRVDELVEMAEQRGIKLYKSTGKDAGKKRGGFAGGKHSPLEAWCEPFKYLDLQQIRESVEKAGDSAMIVALDHVQDPRNLGAVLRSAAAAGVHGVIIESRRCCDVTEVAYETSCGGAEKVKVVRVVNLRQALVEMKKWGMWIAGADERASQDCYTTDLKRPIVLVMGNEGDGISRIVREECDYLMKIPTSPDFPSLNISVASAILIFEAVRQKKLK